ncbi:MAG: hypothetical protein R2828_17925 [Saprospiraceae bacterium]
MNNNNRIIGIASIWKVEAVIREVFFIVEVITMITTGISSRILPKKTYRALMLAQPVVFALGPGGVAGGAFIGGTVSSWGWTIGHWIFD